MRDSAQLQYEALADELDWFAASCTAKAARPIRRFAETEIVLPKSGPHPGRKFRCSYQPYSALWFDAIGSGLFQRHVATGPSQTGKTLSCSVIPTMYHLFETVETVIFGAPSMEINEDKWLIDLKPSIENSRFADLLPRRGSGSQGGFSEMITMRNGASLKFMSGGGDDKKRSHFTGRVLVVTEINALAISSDLSSEADKLKQMEARLRAHGRNAREYLECTVDIETCAVWQEYLAGTKSKIAVECPHCTHWVTPEREHLVGWQDCQSELEAERMAKFYCPDCATAFTEEQRARANLHARLVHRGQEITPEGLVVGAMPETRTLGFRWSAFNNMFTTAGQLGLEEWKASRNHDSDNAEKEQQQFIWCVPVKASRQDVVSLSTQILLDRQHTHARKVIPLACDVLTAGLDLGGSRCFWTVMAWANGRGYVIDYGWLHVPQAMLGLETALIEVMRQFRDLCLNSPWQREDNFAMSPSVVCVDSGWQTPTVYRFIQETGLPFYPTKGLAVGGEKMSYTRPKSTGAIVKWIGPGWHIARLKEDDIDLLEIDADYSKTTLHARLSCDVSAPGAITFFPIDRQDKEATDERHRYVRHLTAEKATEEFIPGRGHVTHWTKIRPDNHWLDSTALALMAGSVAGVEVIALSQGIEVHVPTPPSVPAPQPTPTVIEVAKPAVRELKVRETKSSGWVLRKR